MFVYIIQQRKRLEQNITHTIWKRINTYQISVSTGFPDYTISQNNGIIWYNSVSGLKLLLDAVQNGLQTAA